jgi:hypothetical protein
MADRWRTELVKLRRAELPDDLWGRVLEGPRLEPVSTGGRSRAFVAIGAFAVFALAALLAVQALGPFRNRVPTLAGPSVLAVPPTGQVAADFLPDGRPVFLVHHADGGVSVVDAFSSHRAWGFEELVEWCPSTRQFVEWAHEAHFDEYGKWRSAGPAPMGLATFGFDVVERDAAGDPSSIRVGRMQAPDPGHSPAVTDPSRPPFCPPRSGVANEVVSHTIAGSRIWDSPADAVAAEPGGWIALRGRLLVASDGFVQLCGEIRDGRCQRGAVVRGVDGIGLLLNVIRPFPGKTAYQTSNLWLGRVQGGVIDDPTIAQFLPVS